DRIDIAERPTTESRETDPEDRAHVAVARVPHDAVAETPDRLVHHGERAPLRDLLARKLDVRLDAEECIDGRVHCARSLAPDRLVGEAAAAVAAVSSVGAERRHRARARHP